MVEERLAILAVEEFIPSHGTSNHDDNNECDTYQGFHV